MNETEYGECPQVVDACMPHGYDPLLLSLTVLIYSLCCGGHASGLSFITWFGPYKQCVKVRHGGNCVDDGEEPPTCDLQETSILSKDSRPEWEKMINEKLIDCGLEDIFGESYGKDCRLETDITVLLWHTVAVFLIILADAWCPQ